MIKSVVVPWVVKTGDDLNSARDLLQSLGFRDGEGWSDSNSVGAPCLAPLGAIEFVHGTPPAHADIIVETEDVDAVYRRAVDHGATIVSQPYVSHWNSKLFVVEASGGLRIAFFSFLQANAA